MTGIQNDFLLLKSLKQGDIHFSLPFPSSLVAPKKKQSEFGPQEHTDLKYFNSESISCQIFDLGTLFFANL